MKNVAMNVSGNTLTITINLAEAGTMSKSGKSIVLASTEGNVSAPGGNDVKVGLNVYRPR